MTWEKQEADRSTWNNSNVAAQAWPKIDPTVYQTVWDLQVGILTVWDQTTGGTNWDLGPRINDQWKKVAA